MSRHTVVNEIKAALSKPENRNVLASVNEETGEVRAFMAPVPYWTANKKQEERTAPAENAGPKEIQSAFNSLSGDERAAFANRPMAEQNQFIQAAMNEFRRIGATK